MTFTGQLGTADSMPGNIALGTAGTEGEVAIPRHSTATVTVPDLPSATVKRARDDDG